METFDKYNEMVAEHNLFAKAMKDELVSCGFVDFMHQCFSNNDFDKLEAALKKMDDSVPKAYILRRIKQKRATL